MMRQEGAENGGSRELFTALRKGLPFEAAVTSEGLGWTGLEADRYLAAPTTEIHQPALAHHRLALFPRPPEKLHLEYEGVKRRVPHPVGSILLIPAGCPVQWRTSGNSDSFFVYLEPG